MTANIHPIAGTEIPASLTGAQAAPLALEMERVSGAVWDAAAADFDGICQEQLYVFAKGRWPNAQCEPILFRKNGAVVGGVLVLVQPLPLKLASLAVSKWGPILKDSKASDAAAIYVGMVEALVAEYDGKRGMMLSMQPRAVPEPINAEYAYLSERGFKKGSQLLFPNRYIVNLRLDDEAQRKSFAQKWRYHLNKSMKADLSFEHVNADAFADFDRLYQKMTDRKRFDDSSAYDDTITALMSMPDEKLRPELFFVRHAGVIIAGAIVFKAGDTAVYLYGATDDRALPLRAGYFLHWHVIRWLRDNTGATWYDLGGTDGFQGLHQFKKGMVGDKGAIEPVPPMAKYASRLLPFVVGNLAFLARDAISHIKRHLNRLRPGVARPDQRR